MNRNNLYQWRDDQINIRTGLIALFNLPFIIWQLGILYFSGTTMSVFGRTPITFSESYTAMVIALGYAASILFISLFPRKAVFMERMILPIALAAAILMLFPFPAQILELLFYIQSFGCVFSIGTMASLACHLFTLDTLWRDAALSGIFGSLVIAVLQNDLFKVSFTDFSEAAVILISVLTAFHFLIPSKIAVPYVTRKNKPKVPKILLAGVWALIVLSTLLLCFATSFCESTENGMSILYVSAAVCMTMLAIGNRKLGTKSIRVFSLFFMISSFGFILAFFALNLPNLKWIACALMGFNVVLANLWIFFCGTIFHFYPTRFVGAVGAAIGLVLAMLHSGLLELLRNDPVLLYGVYAVTSGLLMVLYFVSEPYFTYAWKSSISKPPEKTSDRLECGVNLSDQERILAQLILEGHTETSIAKMMNITLNTEKGYRKNLYNKLNIHSKRELFMWAKENNL